MPVAPADLRPHLPLIVRLTMPITHECVSPDARLRFIVVEHDDGDVSLGFDGFAWHTHGDILAALSKTSESEAVEQFVRDLLENRALIAISRIAGEIRNVWITDDPASEFDDLLPDESVELRYWDGRNFGG